MSKQRIQKSKDHMRGGGGGESSSGAMKQQMPRDGDYETALRLQEVLEEETEYSDHRDHLRKGFPTESPRSKKASSRDHAEPYPEEIQDALHEVRKFVAEVMETTCCECSSALTSNFNVHRWFKQWISTKGQAQPSSICSLTCPREECQALTCMGCGGKPRMGVFTGNIDGFHLDWCCESGRLFALWNLLCRFDDIELAKQERSRRQVELSSREPTNTPTSTKKKGTGYGVGGYFFDFFESYKTLHFEQADSKTDVHIQQMLALMTELLPRCGDKNKAAPPALGSMIELSLVQDRVAEFLRNDSLQDATTRAGLYFAVLEFFERLGKHPDTSYLVCEERFVKKQSSGLFVISTGKNSKGKGKARANDHLTLGQGEDSTTASLLTCMSNIGIQSQALLKASRAVISEFRTAAAQDLLAVANRIANLQLSMEPQNIVDPRSGRKSDEVMTWKQYNQKYCMTREENVLSKVDGRLAAKANCLAHSPPNRIKRLVTEASEMATSLPPNIFVKVDEARPDVMKCLMVGPEDTPYEAGLFEFDIFCPIDYPLSPPAIIFRTTAGGRIAFNPNLHFDGKVCLSLLGTWKGPPASRWQGSKSSILSVLVSIQAMILCPDPLENVPAVFGRGLLGLPDSQSYTNQVQAWTVQYAMLDWLRSSTLRNGLWRDVARTYFQRNAAAILRTVNRWKRANKLIASFRETKAMDVFIQHALDQGSAKPRNLHSDLVDALHAFSKRPRR